MIEIIKKTADYVIVNKPVGMPSQSDPSGDPDAMKVTSVALREIGEREELFLIHRLDRVVGGLLVFARNKKTAAHLSSLVADRKFDKWYFAVVEGYAEGGEMNDYIYKDAALNKAFVSDRARGGVKSAKLEYSNLATCEVDGRTLSLVKIKLGTGRFHQIRAQFASRKMPLIGDKKYGSRDFKAKMPALFATELGFNMPREEVHISALPPLADYPWSLFDLSNYK